MVFTTSTACLASLPDLVPSWQLVWPTLMEVDLESSMATGKAHAVESVPSVHVHDAYTVAH